MGRIESGAEERATEEKDGGEERVCNGWVVFGLDNAQFQEAGLAEVLIASLMHAPTTQCARLTGAWAGHNTHHGVRHWDWGR